MTSGEGLKAKIPLAREPSREEGGVAAVGEVGGAEEGEEEGREVDLLALPSFGRLITCESEGRTCALGVR
jgi:hypothetical protein